MRQAFFDSFCQSNTVGPAGLLVAGCTGTGRLPPGFPAKALLLPAAWRWLAASCPRRPQPSPRHGGRALPASVAFVSAAWCSLPPRAAFQVAVSEGRRGCSGEQHVGG
jgi:hypothetical protein